MSSTTLVQPAETVSPGSILAAEPPAAVAGAGPSRKADVPPGLPPLTRGARQVFAVVAALFVASVGLRLNGSSTTFWESKTVRSLRVSDAPSGLLFGTPKFTRGDEWFVWTPAIVAQAHQPDPFPVVNPSLGPGVTPLLMSLPTRYYTTALRPGLWGFFVAPLDYAFSWYWSLKVFGLFAALFTLFWMLTGGRLGLSIFGALAIQFSGFVQWWFSTPAMLPEMLTAWSLGIVAALSFFTRRSWRWQALSAGVFVLCLANFFLCCYPAFEIPLLHLAGCLVGGYVWQKRIFSKTGALLLAGAFVAALGLLTPWFLRCLPTLQIEAHTIYPGQRHSYGGAMTLVRYLSGLFTLGMDETTLPAQLENICEASNFYPLWLLPLGLGLWVFAVRLGRGRVGIGVWLANRGMQVLLAGYLTLLSIYALVPLPPWFCDATLLSRTTEGRSLLTLGVAGTVFLVLHLASRPAGGWRLSRSARWAALVWSVGVFLFLATQQEFLSMQHERLPGSPPERFVEFLTPGVLAGFAATAALAALAYLFAPRWVFPTAWAGALVLKFALVNPVCVGVPALLQSPIMNRLHAIVQNDPTAAWAVYGSVQGVELIKSSGAHVVNGLRVIPDFSIIDRLDPAHRHLDAYNQYSSLYFADAPYQQDVPVSVFSLRYCRIALHPRRMRELFPEVRYVVATEAMPDLAEAGFALIARVPDSRMWLYALGPKVIPAAAN